jgi:hypothetical protein
LEFVEFLGKNERIHIQIRAATLKMTSWRVMSKIKSWKKVKIQDSLAKKTSFWHSILQPLGSFSHVATCRSSSKDAGKMNMQPILNKIHHMLIWSWNWTCLVLLESL